MDYIELIDSKKKPNENWEKIRKTMAVHVLGELPLDIFKERRPIESEENYTLTYRSENYRSITQSEFYKSILDYIAICKKIDKQVNWNENEPYDKKLWHGWNKVSLEDWFIDIVGYYRQIDPNSIIFSLPEHTQEVFTPSFDAEIPDFNTIELERISLMPLLIQSNNIVEINENHVIVKGGEWQMSNGRTNPYYWVVDDLSFWLIYPNYSDKEITYIQTEYYANVEGVFPVIPIGSILSNSNEGSYYIPDYYGAAQWGDLSIGQMSDLQISETRFGYPRHWSIKQPCDNINAGCHLDEEIGCFVTHDEKTCKRCNGTGYIMDMTPLGTRLIDPSGSIEDSKFNAPEGFIAPPTEILKHGAERTNNYYDKMLSSLGIFSQNMTNQSGMSKSYDLIHKQNTIENIVRWIFKSYETFLNFNAIYQNNTTEINKITVMLPEKIDIMNTADIQIRIDEAKRAKMPYSVISELVKSYMIKSFGDGEKERKIINWLSKNDKLFAYGIDELQSAKATLGTNIDNRDLLIHQLGLQLLMDWEGIETATSEQIEAYIDENIIVPSQEIPLI